MVVKNRLTQYMGPASAYSAVLKGVDQQLIELLEKKPQIFTFKSIYDGVVEMRDFGTTGVVAFAKREAFSHLEAGKHNIGGQNVTVAKEYLCLRGVRI